MSVYVDAPIWGYGRMVMCHMLADTREELDAMADAIGVQRKWIQHPGTPKEHYDVCKSKRAKAVELGAIELDVREMAAVMKRKRELVASLAAPSPEPAPSTQREETP